MMATAARSGRGRSRSHSSPSTVAATAALASREPMDRATSPAVEPVGIGALAAVGEGDEDVAHGPGESTGGRPRRPAGLGRVGQAGRPAVTSSGCPSRTGSSTWATRAASLGIDSDFFVA